MAGEREGRMGRERKREREGTRDKDRKRERFREIDLFSFRVTFPIVSKNP